MAKCGQVVPIVGISAFAYGPHMINMAGLSDYVPLTAIRACWVCG